MKKENLKKLFSSRKVIVVGDLILDRFIYGSVKRISPEAPVPIVEVIGERSALGGAANVANNIKDLTGKPVLIGVIGEDVFGREFMDVLKASRIDGANIVWNKKGATTVKTRVIAHHQQVVRVDREKTAIIEKSFQEKLKERIETNLTSAGAIVVSDYAKGTFDHEFLSWIGKKAKENRIPYIVDPKPVHFPYPGATIVTPNRGEAYGFLKKQFTKKTMLGFAKELLSKTGWEAVLLTLGEEGMALYKKGGKDIELIPARMKEVYDVTGAGDTVVSAVALGLASGLSFKDSALLANVAASVVVTKLGTATCSIDELLKNL